jgi:AcrR family transcriptional regulator
MPDSGERKKAGGPRRAERGSKKRSYLAAAKQLFAQFGYAAVTFDQIAEAAGAPRSTLAKSFPDKAALLRALGEEWLEALFATEAPSEGVMLDIVARLHAFSERFLRLFRDDPGTGGVLLAGLAEPGDAEESAIVHDLFRAAVERFAPVIQSGQQEGVIRRGPDPALTAADWLRFLLGAALLPPGELKEGETPAQVIETLLHGVLKTDV